MRKNPIPIPNAHSALVGTTGIRASRAATTMSGPTTNTLRLPLRSAQ